MQPPPPIDGLDAPFTGGARGAVPALLAPGAGDDGLLNRFVWRPWQRLWLVRGRVRRRAVPRWLRSALAERHLAGEPLAAVTRSMTTLREWPQAWTAFAEQRLADGDVRTAGPAFYVAQAPLLPHAPMARALRARSEAAYLKRGDLDDARSVTCSFGNARISMLVQIPATASPDARLPLAVIIAGFGVGKERWHAYARALLDAGMAVLRMEPPDCLPGQGLELEDAVPTALREILSQWAQLDPARVHVYGSCLGSAFALGLAANAPVASAFTVSAPNRGDALVGRILPDICRVFGELPEAPTLEQQRAVMRDWTMTHWTTRIACPVFLVHGARDLMISARAMSELEASMSCPVRTRLYAWEGHGCLGKQTEILAEWLAFMRDAESRGARSAAA